MMNTGAISSAWLTVTNAKDEDSFSLIFIAWALTVDIEKTICMKASLQILMHSEVMTFPPFFARTK